MKAILLCVMMLVAAGAAHAQPGGAELYGDFRYAYSRADAGEARYWTSANNASRLGVRGDVGEGDLVAFFDLQVGVNIDAEVTSAAFTQRYYLAGVRGPVGSLSIGRQSPAYKMAGLRLDPFYDTSTLSTGGGVPVSGLFAGASFGLSPLTNGFADRTIAYSTPSLAGLVGNAALHFAPGSERQVGVGLGYRGYGLDIGAQYHEVDGVSMWPQAAGIHNAVRVHAAYSRTGVGSLGVSYEGVAAVAGPVQRFLYAAATASVTDRLMLAGAIGNVGESAAVQEVTGTAYHAGAFVALFPQARVHMLYSHLNGDEGATRRSAALGFTYSFLLGQP